VATKEAEPEIDPAQSEEHPDSSVLRAYLYDAKGSDREVQPGSGVVRKLGKNELLWVDFDLEDDRAVSSISDWFGIEVDSLREALRSRKRPTFQTADEYFHLSAVMVIEAEPDRIEPVEIHAFVARNWIVTVHDSSLDLVGEFNRPIKGETEIGQLDGPVFLANLLDWALGGYFRVLEGLEDQVDALDQKLLSKEVQREELLAKLVVLRRRITELRQLLVPHRDILAVLTQPDSDTFTPAHSAEPFQRVYERLEKAIDAADNTREMLIGSFEVFMTQTAQRTNDVMKLLTLVSVLLLPCAVIAAILGMNFKMRFFDQPGLFWVAIGVMVVLAASTLIVARLRRWI
jgi:magnesium transporter